MLYWVVDCQKPAFMETPVQVCVSTTVPIELGPRKDCFSASRLCMNCRVWILTNAYSTEFAFIPDSTLICAYHTI